MRSLLLLLAGAALTAAAPPPDVQNFDRLLAASHFKEAGKIIDAQISLRTPTDGIPKPDPLLNSMLGRLYLVAKQPNVALIYLDHAAIAELPSPIRTATAIAHGKAFEFVGNRAGALIAYREALGAALTDGERRNASLGAARQLLSVNPQGARSEAGAIASGPPNAQRWEAQYLVALASSLVGDKDAAIRAADAAWADAISAPLDDLAPLRVATLRAGLAAANGDVQTERAMLMSSNGLSVTATQALSAQMPVCGDKGLRPSDFVIFSFAAGPFLGRQLVPVAASRLEAVAPFQDAIAAILPVKEGNGAKPLGTVFKVSCRSVVDVRFVDGRTDPDPILSWFVEKGMYPARAFNEADDDHLNYVADRVDSLTAKFGKNNPLVIEPQWQRLTMLAARAQEGDPVLAGQIIDLADQVSAGLAAANAPEWIAAMIYEQAKSFMPEQAGMPADEQMAAFIARIRDQLQKLPVKVSYPLFQGLLATLPDQWPPQAAQLVLDYNPRALSTLTSRQRQAWQMTVAEAQRELGKDADARKAIAGAGLDNDLCAAADSPVSLLEQHFSYNDYPDELIANEQEGTVFYEFNLTRTGSVTQPRVVYSLPSGLFDSPSAKGLSTIRYTTPIKQGQASSCRAVYQPIVWRLEGDELTVPQLMPDVGPTT